MVMTGTKLKELRALHGVSQTDVAQYLGYMVKGKPNRSMIARFENEYAPINTRVSMLLDSYFSQMASK
jgi:transcriptional regulator with XRE-family HTH domain